MEKAPVETCVDALYVRFIRALHLRIKYAKRKGQKKMKRFSQIFFHSLAVNGFIFPVQNKLKEKKAH